MWLTTVPVWMSVLFLLVIPIPVLLTASLLGNSAGKHKTAVFAGVLLFFAAYFAYVYVACMNNLFEVKSLPPQILKLTTMPLMVFLVVIVFNTPFYKSINRNASAAVLVRIHLFRLIGSFLLILSITGELPLIFGVISGAGDIITAVASIFVARMLEQKIANAKRIALIWNTFGLLDIIATSAMAFIFTKLAMDTGGNGVQALARFPFCLIPALAPPLIIFLHLTIYRKLLIKSYM
jgi:hypothetical protein